MDKEFIVQKDLASYIGIESATFKIILQKTIEKLMAVIDGK